MPPRNLAEARRLHPDLGFALYALEPRGAVTLEVLDGERSHTFVGVTEAEAWSAAFPGAAPDEPPERRVDALRTDPKLLALLDRARGVAMTPEQSQAQRRSWVVGQIGLSRPDADRAEIEALVDSVLEPVDEPAQPAEPARAPSVFD